MRGLSYWILRLNIFPRLFLRIFSLQLFVWPSSKGLKMTEILPLTTPPAGCSQPSRGPVTADLDPIKSLQAPGTERAVSTHVCVCVCASVSTHPGLSAPMGDACHRSAQRLLQADEGSICHSAPETCAQGQASPLLKPCVSENRTQLPQPSGSLRTASTGSGKREARTTGNRNQYQTSR